MKGAKNDVSHRIIVGMTILANNFSLINIPNPGGKGETISIDRRVRNNPLRVASIRCR
jgi:hypothetical protein